MPIRTSAFAWVCTFILSVAIAAAAEPALTLDVWPANPPGQAPSGKPEQWTKKRVTDVTHPTLAVFRPEKASDTGVCVIVCPGGGYKALMMDYEGEDVARWLNTIGVTGIVLKYRVPAPAGTPGYVPALADAQRSMSLVRSKAAEWGIDLHRIGMLGFSAGGHLTAATCTNFDKRSYPPIDAIDEVDCRPDFGVSIYPGGVVRRGSDQLSPEILVSSQTPPMFIVQANDDPVNADNSAYLYLALKHAHVPAELHIYATGGHGFGLRPSNKPCSTWPQRLHEWLISQGILPAAASANRTQ